MQKRNQIVVAVKGIVLHKGKILIIKRSESDAVGGGTWECAGGKIEFGEELETALVRETKEETGLDIRVEQLLYAATFITDPARQLVLFTYLCRSERDDVTLSEEHTAFEWADRGRLRQLLPLDIVRDFEKHHVFSIAKLQ
ncbi:NUDIX hydrolase [Paenibacillus piri]|uniref:NUDIX domain-containing protein n=1 Tax=Paenibacillus piri TaxID=2547395 RepID=A0A4R5KXH5_9BACL|nr:NUDIX domain-containing protein [Paenibacillus piri]TDG00283.1 NUDIX domain-containing protein [Paenibacillus piri]